MFLALGGLMALHMRLQLMFPDNDLMGPGLFNESFTMHGTTMMFLFAVPVMQGVQIYLTPLMVGTRAMAFPRLTAFSYYMYLFGGLFLWAAHFMRFGPDNGWFSYVPLAGPQFGIGKRADVWAQTVTFTEVAALAVAVTLVATILKQRAPGMTLARMPIFVWATLVTSLMVIFSMPAVALVSSLLLSDRLVGTQFFNPVEHGDPLLWQHLFWFFGHPEVYIIFLPATGFVSEIVSTFSRRSLFGYPLVVLSLVATGILAFGLWVHHMFATGLPRVGYSFYTAASMAVSIPTGIQIFCWIATMWDGRPRLQVPMLYVIALHHHLRHRRTHRSDDRRRAARPPASRHLLHRRPFPLRADRRRGIPAARGDHLLVSQVHRPADVRAARQDRLLDDLPRLPAGLLPDAHRRPDGDAAPGLHLPRRDGARAAQHALDASARRWWRSRCCCSSST